MSTARFLPCLLAFGLGSCGLFAATEVPEPPAPVIPAANFNITAYGAVGDGRTLNTAAFGKAIDACQQAGGGSVIVPPGDFVTGPFHLVSHMALVVETGATIQSSGKPSDFGLPSPLPATQDALNRLRPTLRALISGKGLTDVAIRGGGTIDGAGAWWWAHSDRAARENGGTYVPRPNLVVIQDCQRLQVAGVTLRNSPQFHLVPKLCADVLIDGIKIIAPADSPNTDAIDPSNCRDMLIRHVMTDNGDDNVAFKAGGDGPCENITVTDCTFFHGHGVSIGSETNGGVHNILVQRCTFENTGTAIRIKSSRARGGLVDDVTYRDITMKNVDQAIYINLFYEDKSDTKYPQPKPMTKLTPQVRNILISNIQCVNAKAAGQITGLPESAASAITLQNVHVTAWTGFTLEDTQGLTFTNVSFITSPKPPDALPMGAPSPASKTLGLSGTSPKTTGTGVTPFTTGTAPTTTGTMEKSITRSWPAPVAVPLTPELKAKVLTGSLTVAADGSGDLKSVQEAVHAAPDAAEGGAPFVIHIKPGTYREIVNIPPQKGAIRFEGENADTTIITGSNNAHTPDADGKPLGTFRSATVFVQDADFSASNITFENSAGNTGQALAINVGGDRAIFRKCRFLGWQDTILLLQRRQYFEDCRITGVTDFIFGAAAAYFQRCDIHCLSNGYITAASTPQEQPYGFVFANCAITAEPNVKTYLGRPWRPFASVAFLNTLMSSAIQPDGWHPWKKTDTQESARYSEYASTGPGASPATRVPWSRQLTAPEAATLTPATVLGGWSPAAMPPPKAQ